MSHIAIVDDHRDIRNLVGKCLHQHGYRIVAVDPAAARTALGRDDIGERGAGARRT
ncbi:hypothetical protein [Luteimonas suaedae]|uniref:hypothetical protein n=1 Tax=Luteimonas suaedae TaxID=2605430 RepID=UPI001CA9AF82|nr:hypothetical protein [Luteimonas suaedae]